MESQRYRHRIAFQEPIYTQDALTGAAVLTWGDASTSDITLTSVPCEVLEGPGREALTGGSKYAEATARINLRWFSGLDPSWRILWQGRALNIVSIETDATGRREYRLRVQEGLTDGQ